jgi:hypothetical protein
VASNRKLTNLTDYTSVLPYSSEMFGVYQTLIGWKSKRILNRIKKGRDEERFALLERLVKHFQGVVDVSFNVDCFGAFASLEPGRFAGNRLLEQRSLLLNEIREMLKDQDMSEENRWRELIHPDRLRVILHEKVFPHYQETAMRFCRQVHQHGPLHGETEEAFEKRKRAVIKANQDEAVAALENESKIAGALLALAENNGFAQLSKIFYSAPLLDPKAEFARALANSGDDFEDPYLSFDPKKDVKDVSLSPVGIVHLFRQFFFEFDTFLGTPTGHVWLSPGATVELIEVSTRKTITEKSYEQAIEKVTKSETSLTQRDEISEAVKDENRNDLKLGITSTVNQSWGTGNVSATASLNMDKTQQVARENTHKKMREQTEKLSTEIRQNFKSTFKTITEVTDTSSKRYVLANNTNNLINYELRRKMRQVGIQVQDIGSFLCWSTFIDEPGESLGLANLVHIAQPADLVTIPDQTTIPYPADKFQTFTTNATWNFGDTRKYNDPNLGFVHLTTCDVPPPADGFKVKPMDPVAVKVISYSGEDSENQMYAFSGKLINNDTQIQLGVVTGPGGIEWDERIDFVVGGAITYTATAAKKAEIDAANKAKLAAGKAADEENKRLSKEAFLKAAKERIEMAANIEKRKYEDLREEERIVVYRKLIGSLMTDFNYRWADKTTRHTLSELINSIFDIDKMLYFVAPEWWKPRKDSSLVIGENALQQISGESIVTWSDNVPRKDNYLITDKSKPAAMGSSLGWLLQLDGDTLRNAFLNAPWVKAVIPIRPGKEQAAIHWLQNVQVEGADGMDAAYAAPADELNEIRAKLLEQDPEDPVGGHVQVTIGDAIRYLCLQVSLKHRESVRTDRFPKGVEIHDDDKVSSTPIDKVYEHGFYPLQGSFRYDPADPDPNNPDRNFQVYDQWVEILPTDQVVPVEVKYDPKTGRQV